MPISDFFFHCPTVNVFTTIFLVAFSVNRLLTSFGLGFNWFWGANQADEKRNDEPDNESGSGTEREPVPEPEPETDSESDPGFDTESDSESDSISDSASESDSESDVSGDGYYGKISD